MTRLKTAFRHFVKAPKKLSTHMDDFCSRNSPLCALLFCLNHLPLPCRTGRLTASARQPITNFTRYASCKARTLATTSGNLMNNHYITELWWRTALRSAADKRQRHVSSSLEPAAETFVYQQGSQSFWTPKNTSPVVRGQQCLLHTQVPNFGRQKTLFASNKNKFLLYKLLKLHKLFV